MPDPQSYQWDYDRNPWDSKSEAKTFSVGVYQWLPKANGKGLKKSITIRVMGCVAEADAVYSKADELCLRLNTESAHVDNPPAWLQKQYSVPKPADLVFKRASKELKGAEAKRFAKM
jgi:hypothetical protein